MKVPVARATVVGALILGVGSVPVAAGASSRAHAKASSTVTVSGTVVASDASRHTIVIAGHNSLATLRVNSVTSTHVATGAHVVARATRLSDGTDRVVSLRVHGAQHHVRFRAVVVASNATSLTVSGGNSVVTLARVARHAHDSGTTNPTGTPGVGTIVSVDAGLGAQGFDDLGTSVVGTTSLISLEGTLSAVSTTSLSITSEDGVVTQVSIPSSITLPSTIQSGQQAELVASFSAGTFTLVTISVDNPATLGSQGVSQFGDENQIEVEGLVVASSSTSLTIQPGDGALPVVLAVPSTVDVSSVTVGAFVHASATMLNNVLTLTEIRVEDSSFTESSTTEVEGIVVSNTAGTLLVQTEDSTVPVSITVPSTIDASAAVVGARVHVVASIDPTTGSLTLVRLDVQQPEGDTPGGVVIEGAVVTITPATTLVAGSLVIQPGDGAAPVTVSVPSGVDVTGIAVGSQVTVMASLQGTVLTATSVTLSH
ncbi:MAG: hypothetical protein KGJ39_02075 [Acidobacteriota bacterium]|nr:hypothetical protein [Acidobacteriota bacterium]